MTARRTTSGYSDTNQRPRRAPMEYPITSMPAPVVAKVSKKARGGPSSTGVDP